jgi:hypothetical protein
MNRAVFSARLALGLFAAGALAATAPVQAKTDKETPGGPCADGPGKGVGNPCKGNNGNPSPEGNAKKERVDYNPNPTPFTIARPGNDRGAFINQIGDANRAMIGQQASGQYARIDQNGETNLADVAQAGSAAHYATVNQTGDANALSLTQGGSAVQVALLSQQGNGNVMAVGQQGASVSSGVAASQLGDNNAMTLAQSGDNNQALLTQNGSGNAMTASQTGGNNQLIWTQNGDYLSDLAISQQGGAAIQVTQSR